MSFSFPVNAMVAVILFSDCFCAKAVTSPNGCCIMARLAMVRLPVNAGNFLLRSFTSILASIIPLAKMVSLLIMELILFKLKLSITTSIGLLLTGCLLLIKILLVSLVIEKLLMINPDGEYLM